MADYSGYAQRPQQDPNLAAWAQIGGNIANIFGLDPAKAAEARRGQQQEDYNEMRNQAHIRQQLANEEIGNLLSGEGFDRARGEFKNPGDFMRFTRAMSVLGDARQAIPFAPGRWQAQIDSTIDRENRTWDHRAEVQSKADEARAIKEAEIAKRREAEAAKTENENLGRQYEKRRQYGGKVATYNVRAAWDDFFRDFNASAPRTASERYVATPETAALPENKREYKITDAWVDWMNKHGLGSNVAENENVRYRDDTFLSGQNQLALKLAPLMNLPANHPYVLDLADRIYAAHINKQIQEQEAPTPAVETQAEVDKIITQAQTDPANAPRWMLLRIPVVNPNDGSVTFQHKYLSVAAVAKMSRDNANHPINILQRSR